MSSPLTCIVIRNGATTCYHDRHAGATFPEMLIAEPAKILAWAVSRPVIDTLDTDAYCDLLIDCDHKRLLYWYAVFEEPVYIPYEEELFALLWQDFHVSFAYGGRNELGEYARIAVQDKSGPGYGDAADVADLAVAFPAQAALYFLSVITSEPNAPNTVARSYAQVLGARAVTDTV